MTELTSIVSGAVMDASNITSSLLNIPGFNALIRIGQTAGILVIVYILFLIGKGLLQLKQTMRVRNISKEVSGINERLDRVIKLLEKTKNEKSANKNKK